MGSQEGWYVEDVEDFRMEIWRTGSSLISYISFFDPKEDNLKGS